MRLTDWAKTNCVTYRTAWQWYKDSKIAGAYRLPSGAIRVPDPVPPKQRCVVTYARVSSSENKRNLELQSGRLVQFCNANGWETSLNITEVGSGLNDTRKKLMKVLAEGRATKLVVEHKDRLTRFGFSYIECLCKHIGCEIVILNPQQNDRDDLMQDFVSLVTSFCARLYGLRRSRRNTEKLIKELNNAG